MWKVLIFGFLGVVVAGTSVQADDCSMVCATVYDPVCGSNGETYSTECEMKAEACREKTSVSVQHRGECQKEAETECLMVCPMNYDPICGSDGNTYSNECEMQGKACLKKKKIALAHKGACNEPIPELYVAENEECLMMCPMLYAPLCGSDGETYSNDCAMKSQACVTKKVITKSHDGPCREAQDEPECQMKPCMRIYNPICASNGESYPNECEMENAACSLKKHLEVKHRGEC